MLKDNGWVYKSCNIWDKGKSHIAGNLNTKTIRSFPIVTEVCVQYVRKSEYRKSNNLGMSVQEWLRNEWLRAGFSLSKANEVCGVKAAAVRKYLTLDHLWYMPSIEIFQKLSDYANLYGKTEGKPYFSKEYEELYKESLWECMRAKFRCPFGVTNVWSESQLRGSERLKSDGKVVHLNQKPLSLIKRLVEVSSDKGDVVWDPFGGLFTTAIACKELDRACYSSERNMSIFEVGCKRVEEFCDKGLLGKFERS